MTNIDKVQYIVKLLNTLNVANVLIQKNLAKTMLPLQIYKTKKTIEMLVRTVAVIVMHLFTVVLYIISKLQRLNYVFICEKMTS